MAQGEPIPVPSKQFKDDATGEAAVAVAFCTCRSLKWLCMEWAVLRSVLLAGGVIPLHSGKGALASGN